MKADKYKQFSKEYATYSKTMEKKLDALGDTAFKPSLVTLDKVSESISLQ
jgi:hypothetical protein